MTDEQLLKLSGFERQVKDVLRLLRKYRMCGLGEGWFEAEKKVLLFLMRNFGAGTALSAIVEWISDSAYVDSSIADDINELITENARLNSIQAQATRLRLVLSRMPRGDCEAGCYELTGESIAAICESLEDIQVLLAHLSNERGSR
jgi:hypothetical protein